jgi:thiol-disulfide isomerase/thioredoxin
MNSISRRSFFASLGVAIGAASVSWPASAASHLLEDQGPAPGFTGIDKWLNSGPLSIQDLAGKVVLVDFWTYSCVNCVNTLPHVVRWYEKYKDQGFVVVGVHTPEFAFEKSTPNVEAAIQRFGIRYPVAQDNRFATWKAWHNQFWPAFYLVDKSGRVVRQHFGEGEYDQMEQAIKTLLAQPAKG